MKQFTRIKFKDGKMIIRYQERDSERPDEVKHHELESMEAPHPDLITALEYLGAFVPKICDLPPRYSEGIKVTGVSLSWTETDDGVVMAATIACVKTLKSKRVLVINTPHMPARPYSSGSDDVTLSPGCVETIEGVMREAEAYWTGEKRAQQSLPLGGAA